jgi:hypothetical protein
MNGLAFAGNGNSNGSTVPAAPGAEGRSQMQSFGCGVADNGIQLPLTQSHT